MTVLIVMFGLAVISGCVRGWQLGVFKCHTVSY